MRKSNTQLNMPPMAVEPLNRTSEKRLSTQPKAGKTPNLLRITRRAMERANLSSRWLAHIFGCSEQLISAQLSDHAEDKHLSMRKLGRVDDVGFWREFLYLLAEDLGFQIVVVTPEQSQALRDVAIALQRVSQS